MIAVTGYRTTIVQELALLRPEEHIVRIRPGNTTPRADRYVFAAGLLHGRRVLEQSPAERSESLWVNFVWPMVLCEEILETNPRARICVIGSESGFHGSHDMVYATAKAALHAYVRMRKIGPEQLLAVVAPPIIADSGMTRRRHDFPEVLHRRSHVTARRVAVEVERVLYEDRTGETFVRGLG